ncbi:hypothetical protein EJ02DRAFT_457926 [Clathrospora elynae]|uniref:Uncharacterized protein n=1 Tax=Clathrospora elynae TaxID=706981 RepID=A0A6A5SCM2_9PLEO|nr:hypothetical protein EJ02DRAFT_457926 [Clathrospora elynae]
MKFTTTLLLAIMATVTIATPMATPAAIEDVTSATSNTNMAQTTCGDCDTFYVNCRKTIGCWLNPYGCTFGCRTDTCRALDGYCKASCPPYQSC